MQQVTLLKSYIQLFVFYHISVQNIEHYFVEYKSHIKYVYKLPMLNFPH